MSYIKGVFNSALENGFKALEYSNIANNDEEITRALINIGLSYLLVSNSDKQLEYFKMALLKAHECKDTFSERLALNNLAFTYASIDDLDSSRKYLALADTAYINNQNNVHFLAFKLTQVSIALQEQQYNEAFELLQLVEKHPLLTLDQSVYMDWHLEYAHYHELNGNSLDQVKHLTLGLAIAERLGSKQYSIKFLESLYTLNRRNNDLEKAIYYQERSKDLLKNINREKDDYQYMLFFQVQYEIEHMSKQVSLLSSELKDTQESTIYALATLAEYRDEVTGKHILRTIEYVRTFLELMNKLEDYPIYTSDDISNIGRSSALHDIGKVGISDIILHKPGKLNHDEFEQMKLHTIIGHEALSTTKDVLGNKSFF